MLLLKGIIVGIGKIIPGVSGAFFAILLKIYEPMIDSINNIFNNFKSNFIYLLKIFIGVFLGIFLFSNVIFYFIDNYYLYTFSLFTGLILGNIFEIKKRIDVKNRKIVTLSFLIFFIIYLFLNKITLGSSNNLTFFISGFLETISILIPGISGTSILMVLGTYDDILYLLSNFLNFQFLLTKLNLIIYFSLGLILSFLIVIKLLNYCIKKKYNEFSNAVYGLFLFNIIIMMLNIIKLISINNLLQVLIFFVLGCYTSKKINQLVID